LAKLRGKNVVARWHLFRTRCKTFKVIDCHKNGL